jgi:hypothetical protein
MVGLLDHVGTADGKPGRLALLVGNTPGLTTLHEVEFEGVHPDSPTEMKMFSGVR